jgi:M6 family metalloprotease-like protein
MPAAEQAVGQRTIIPRILVIMANFTDYELVSSTADVDSMFNAVNWTKDGATGSVRQYFYDQSMGQYNPQFDIVGPVTLSNGYAYYGGGCSSTTRSGYMVTEACALVDEQVDFTEYDSNNDGKVDLVYVFFAGFGENDPPTTDLIPVACNLPWPHYWNVVSAGYGSNPREFDGKKIYDYEISNELDGYYSTTTQKVISGIGVLCHEFGHALGLPDTYSTGSSAHNEKLLGSWDIMCYGPYNNDMHTPPSYTAYERFYMGWLTPELTTKGDTLTLEN